MDKHYIGIDPSISNTGLAFFNKTDYSVQTDVESFWGVVIYLNHLHEKYGKYLRVIIEDNNLNKTIFDHRKSNKYTKGKGEAYSDTIIQNVGKNKAVCTLLCDYMDMKNIDYKRIKPTKSKKSKVYVKNITGLTVGDQNARDALMLLIDNNCVLPKMIK